LLKEGLKGHPLDGKVLVDSAGLINPGNPASRHVRTILSEDMGIDDVMEHRSKIVTPALISEQDLILPMGVYEMEGLLDVSVHSNTHLYMDWAYGTKGQEVEDPYGYPHAKYCDMVRILEQSVELFIRKLEKEIKRKW